MTDGTARANGEPLLSDVRMQWGVQIPLRDGTRLNATVYLPKNDSAGAPAVLTLTPYIGQTWHDQGLYFAAHGYPFLDVDVRGRGNSEGTFRPLINEADDAFDVVEWVARQPYCSGQVTMWGGSYGGYVQWAAASRSPPHLATIVPVASPYISVDFPIRSNLARPYWMKWLTLVWGRTGQDKLFWNTERFWGAKFRHWFESGTRFKDLDSMLGCPSPAFQEWVAHPEQGGYWDQYNPTAEQYAAIAMPVLTITGSYDGDQPGALMHYREHLRAAPNARTRHFLVIGPWDHAGTRVPKQEFCGIKVGPESLVDLAQLHRQWYAWTMQRGPKPRFLQKNVAYYVMDADRWRYADSLDAVTARSESLYLDSAGNPADVFCAGSLGAQPATRSEPDWYRYDPRDISLAELESTVDPDSRADDRMVHAAADKHLVYHSAPFAEDREISGFFKLVVWLAIDRPDTDFRAAVYEVALGGSSLLLTSDSIRARYRESLRVGKLVGAQEQPLRYSFEGFMFVSRRIRKGHRLRLVFGPINSIYAQKNYNSGGVVSEESVQDARPVQVRLFHDASHASTLYVPIGQAEHSGNE